MQNVTLRHIADAAGVSLMTVSRALKGNPRHSAATRARIKRIATELGYKPHPYVSALMSGLARSQDQAPRVNLAVLHFLPLESVRRHSFYRGVCERARSLGYTPEAFLYESGRAASDRLRRILLSRGIRGIILMPAAEGFTSLEFDFEGFAVAALGHTIMHPPLPRVSSEIYTGTFRALDELVRRGYTRIGMINTDYVNRLANFLYTAAVMAYRRHVDPGIHLVDYIVEEPVGSSASLGKMKAWILKEKLQAVVCPAFDLPLYDILRNQGFKIPGRLAYLHLLDHATPRVSCMKQMGEFMGAKAVDVVTSMINRNEFSVSRSPQVVGIRSQWHEGRTTPALKRQVT